MLKRLRAMRMKADGYWKRLKHHPGVPLATILSAAGPVVALQNPDGDWRLGLIMLVAWVPVLITARTQPLPREIGSSKRLKETEMTAMNKPSWEDAPEGAEWLAQDESGWWNWFTHQPFTSLSQWDAKSGVVESASQGDQSNPRWRETLERRPESEIKGIGCGMQTAILAMVYADAFARASGTQSGTVESEGDGTKAGCPECKSKTIQDALDVTPPDLVIPRGAANELNAFAKLKDLADSGYRIEVDSGTIRGWKESDREGEA